MTMTTTDDLAAQVAELRAAKCTDKVCLTAKYARMIAADTRAPGGGARPEVGRLEAYPCPFADEHDDPAFGWHVGHPMSMAALVRTAQVLRARSGNAPGPRPR